MRNFAGWILIGASMFFTLQATAKSSYDLRSPDNRIEVRIRTLDQIRYDMILNGAAVLENSTISLDVDHKKLGVDPKVIDTKKNSHDQMVEPVVRQKFARIRDHFNELRLTFDGGYSVVFRAYNEGVAYRFETALPQKEIKVYGEEGNFKFAATTLFIIRKRTVSIHTMSGNTYPSS